MHIMCGVHIFIGLLFILFGLLFMRGTGVFLLNGYNRLSQEKQDSYDEKALSRFMGKICFALAISWFMMALSDVLESMFVLGIAYIVFAVAFIFGMIYPNTGNRFKK